MKEAMLVLEMLQVTTVPAGTPVKGYIFDPEQIAASPLITGFVEIRLETFVVLIVCEPMLFGSSQLLSLVAFVPPPVQDKSKRP